MEPLKYQYCKNTIPQSQMKQPLRICVDALDVYQIKYDIITRKENKPILLYPNATKYHKNAFIHFVKCCNCEEIVKYSNRMSL